jgi:putative YphP/YqiW family bacilliredoxin
MYPEEITRPCRLELEDMGVRELMTPADVDNLMQNHTGTSLIFVNSVCGCAAGSARPALRLALQNENKPDETVTVFAGVEPEATDKARRYMVGAPPSSPSMALFKDGKLVFMIERHMIEGRYPEQIADALKVAFDEYCNS